MNQAIHQLDSLISFLGDPVEVSAVMGTFLRPIEAEDMLAGWVRFASGACATVECTVLAHQDIFTIDIIGEHSQIRIEGSPLCHRCLWSLSSSSSATKHALVRSALRDHPDPPRDPQRAEVMAEKIFCRLSGRTWLPPNHWGHTPYVKDFLESVSAAATSGVSSREAKKSLELATALYMSAFTGTSVTLPISGGIPFYEGIAAAVTSSTQAQAHYKTMQVSIPG